MFAGLTREFGLLARWRNPHLERRMLERAAAVVSVMEQLPSMLEEGLGVSGLASRFHWIPNGYDPEDFEGVAARTSSEFTLTYSGALYGSRSLRPIAQVLDDLVREGKMDRDRLRLQVLGPPPSKVIGELAGLSILNRVHAPGSVSHAEALSHQLGSTINLLVDIVYEGPNVHAPGKLYEYLRAGRPILALSKPGLTPQLIEEADGGWVVPPDDMRALREVLVRAYEDWSAGRPLPRPRLEAAERFDRARLAARLKGVLEGVVKDHGARS